MSGSQVGGGRAGRSWANTALLVAFGIAAGIMVVLIVAAFVVPPTVDRWVETYTDAEPMRATSPPPPKEERDAARERLDAFVDALDQSRDARPSEFTLSEEEMRALIETEQDVTKPRIGMELELLPGRIRTAVSMPIKDNVALGPWQADTHGRYLNGYATIAMNFSDGAAHLKLETLETPDGKPFPSWARSLLNRELDGALDSDDARDVLDKLERIEIRDGSLVMRAKP